MATAANWQKRQEVWRFGVNPTQVKGHMADEARTNLIISITIDKSLLVPVAHETVILSVGKTNTRCEKNGAENGSNRVE